MSISTKDGGSAFPVADMQLHGTYGMTLRDYLAAKAMSGFCSRDGSIHCSAESISKDAYAVADAMLRTREVQS